jgi:hypothetical protein
LELENVVLVGELEIEFALIRDGGFIGVEGQLGGDGRWNREEQQNASRAAAYLKRPHGCPDALAAKTPRSCSTDMCR